MVFIYRFEVHPIFFLTYFRQNPKDGPIRFQFRNRSDIEFLFKCFFEIIVITGIKALRHNFRIFSCYGTYTFTRFFDTWMPEL